MKVEPFLLTLALLGVGVAGFSGLIVTLPRQGKSQLWQFNEVAGVKLLLEYSFSLIFLSLLPSIISQATGNEPRTWIISTSVAAIFIALETLIQLYRAFRAYRQDAPPRSPMLLLLIIAPGLILLVVLWKLEVDLVAWYQVFLLWVVAAIGMQFWFFIEKTLTD